MDKSKGDHVLALFRAGISAVPIVGGSIASLVGDYIPSSTQRRIEQAIEFFDSRLREVNDRVDIESINREEFAELFKSSYLTIVRSHHDEKIHAAISVIVNAVLRQGDLEKLSFDELDHFSRAVDQLSVGAMRVLASIYRIVPEISIKAINTRTWKTEFQVIKRELPGEDPALLMGLVGELNAMNLIHVVGAPAIRTSNYGNYPIELTPLGTRFVERIMRM